MVDIPQDATPQERALYLQGGPSAQLAQEMYTKRTQKEPTPTPITQQSQDIPLQVQAKIRQESITQPTRTTPTPPPPISKIQQSKASLTVIQHQLQQTPTTAKFKYGGKTYTRDELISTLQNNKTQIQKYINRKADLESYLQNLRNKGFDAYIDKQGQVQITGPSGMDEREEMYWRIHLAPEYYTFKDEKGRTLRRDIAIERADLGYKLYQTEEDLKWKASQPIWSPDFWEYVSISVGAFISSPLEVGGAYLTEAVAYTAPLFIGIAATPNVGKGMKQWQSDLTKQRFEIQASLKVQWDKALAAAENGNYDLILKFAQKPIIEWGTIAATAYIGSAGVGALQGTVQGAVAGTQSGTIAGYSAAQIGNFVNTALKIGFGGLVAWEIGSTVGNIYNIEQDIRKEQEKYNDRIKRIKDEKERKQLARQHELTINSLRSKRARQALRLGAIATFIGLSAGLSKTRLAKRLYEGGYARGYQYGFGKTAFKGKPKLYKGYKHAIKSIRALEKTTPYKLRTLKGAKQVSQYRTKKALEIMRRTGGVVGGSSATYPQTKAGRFPKDIESLYPYSKKSMLKAKQLFRKSIGQQGLDIHGEEFYKPGEFYNIGFKSQKPIKLKGQEYIRIGEQIGRKGTVTLQMMAGKGPHPGRIKDIADYFQYTGEQIGTSKGLGPIVDKFQAARAEYHFGKFKSIFESVYGKGPYQVTGGTGTTRLLTLKELAAGVQPTPTAVSPYTGKPITTPNIKASFDVKPIIKNGKIIGYDYGSTYYGKPDYYLGKTTPYYPTVTKVKPSSYYKPSYDLSKIKTIYPTTKYPTTSKTPISKTPTSYAPSQPAPKYPTSSYPKPSYPKPSYPKPSYTTGTYPKGKPIPKPPKPIIKTIPKRPTKPTPQGYHAYAKKDATKKSKTHWVKVTDKPRTYNEAHGVGLRAVDETVARTFKVVKANKPAQSVPSLARDWQFKRHKVRKPIRKGKPIKSDKWIEKTTYAIDSPGEFRGITVKGWKAARQKRRKQQLKPPTPKQIKIKSQKPPSNPKTLSPNNINYVKPKYIVNPFKIKKRRNKK